MAVPAETKPGNAQGLALAQQNATEDISSGTSKWKMAPRKGRSVWNNAVTKISQESKWGICVD